MTTDDKPRWYYRFDNYQRAFLLLREAIELATQRELTALEEEGAIQRFEYSWELAWKLMKDYLIYEGVTLEIATPKTVIKSAFQAGIIKDGELWMKALDARNKMSHVYSSKAFREVIEDIKKSFLAIFDALHMFFLEKVQRS